MERLFDVEVTVVQTRRYKNIPATNAGTAEAVVTQLVEEDPKGMDGDIEFDVYESVSEDVTAYVSEEE